MKIFAADLFTKASPVSRAGKIFQFPLIRILIAICFMIPVLLFGFAHALNENATLFTSFSVAVSEGLILTAAYIFSRTLWLPLGFHWGWNFAQSGIFGMPNSGTAYNGLLIPEITGAEWLTGGKWGIEGSYMAILLCLIAGIVLIILAIRNAQIVRPVWKRAD